MKKSKKIPKTYLPKYYQGGSSKFNEFQYDSDTQPGSSATNAAYNEKRTKGLTGNQYAQLGNAAMMTGSQMMMNNQLSGEAKQQANAQTMNNIADQAIQMIPGFGQYYGMAKGASDMGRSMIAKDENGLAANDWEQSADNFMKPTHSQVIDDVSKGQYGEAALGMVFNKGIGSAIGAIAPNTKFGKWMSDYGKGEKVFAMGGMNMVPNAEIEKQENVVAPNGGFLQANGSTHENGGVPVALPGNSMIFSDRLKVPGTKKTFADLNKVNNTNKEDKLLESNKLGNISKHTAELMKFAKNKNSEALFNVQEGLKQAKVQAYAKKMGVALPQPNMQAPQAEFTMGGVKLPMYTNKQNELPKFGPGGRYVNGVWVEDNQPTEGFQADTWNTGVGPVNNLGEVSNVNNLITNQDFNKFKDANAIITNDMITHQNNRGAVMGSTMAREIQADKLSGKSQYLPDNNNIRNNPNLKTNKVITSTPPPNSNKFNWGEAAMNVGNFAAQNAGNIYDLTRKNDPLQSYERAKASYLDPTAALRDAEHEARLAEYGVRNASGGNAGTYLSARTALNSQNVMNKDRIRQQYANANAQIGNQNSQFNTEIAYREAEARAKDAAMKENVNSQAVHSIASNFGKFTKSNKEDSMDQTELAMFQQRYKNEPEFRKMIDKFSTSKKSKGSK